MDMRTWDEILEEHQQSRDFQCVLCGEANPDVRERHHITRNPDLLLDLCSNCHRVVTLYERKYHVHEESLVVIDRYEAIKARLLDIQSWQPATST